jgi:hypothetical protein
MTIEIQTIVENWQEDESPVYRKLRAIREATAHCPCNRCPGWTACKKTGNECASFKRWCKTGSTKEVK